MEHCIGKLTYVVGETTGFSFLLFFIVNECIHYCIYQPASWVKLDGFYSSSCQYQSCSAFLIKVPFLLYSVHVTVGAGPFLFSLISFCSLQQDMECLQRENSKKGSFSSSTKGKESHSRRQRDGRKTMKPRIDHPIAISTILLTRARQSGKRTSTKRMQIIAYRV